MILLDTHAAAWLAVRPQRLSRQATAAIRRAQGRGGLAIASVSLMELAQMLAVGVIRPTGTPQSWLRAFLTDTSLATRELTLEIAAVAAHLPRSFPADPFDRMIVATAIVEKLPLVTADAGIQDSGVVPIVW